MIVWVDDRLFADQSKVVDRLALLRNVALRRHTLIISTSPDAARGARSSPDFDAWFAALPDRLKREIKILRERTDWISVSAVTRGANRVLVCAQDPGPLHRGCRLSLSEAVRALAQPLCILVENQINDAAFLRRIMPPLWRKQLDAWERCGELRYENAGGISVMSALVDFHCDDQSSRLAFGLPAEVWRLVHFIVFDHDGDTLESPSEYSRALKRSCQKAGLGDRSHCLERRDQEHYLPVEALRRIVEERVTNMADRERLLAAIDEHAAKGDARHFVSPPSLSNNFTKSLSGLFRNQWILDDSFLAPRSCVCFSFDELAQKNRQASSLFFKNEFTEPATAPWPDDWFERDRAWPEMTRLAERIASAM